MLYLLLSKDIKLIRHATVSKIHYALYSSPWQQITNFKAIKNDLIKGVASAMELADMAKDAIDKDVNDLDPEVKRLASMLFAESDFPKLGDVYGGIGIQRRLTSVEDEKDKRIPVSHENKALSNICSSINPRQSTAIWDVSKKKM